jgi:protein involved in polysaccharide export with SLBB domain
VLVEVLEALPGRPISGERLVRPDGKISLGFYGELYVAGLTPLAIKQKVIQHLRKFLSDEILGIAEIDPEKDAAKLDANGEPILIKDLTKSDRVFVDVTAYNSKNYYVQGEVVIPCRLPVTGRETILDAIHYAEGLTLHADHRNVVLYRQAKGGALQKLPINIDQIMMGDDLSTNYQLEPGDRLVVPRIWGQSSGAPRTEAERPSTVPTKRQAPTPYFDRSLDAKSDRPHDELRQPASDGTEPATSRRVDRDPGFGGTGLATLRRLEQRLSEVERKLDRILKVLEPNTP